MCGFTFDDGTIRSEKFAGHHAETSEALCKNVALYVSVIVLGGPNEPAGRLDSLCNHIIDQTVLIINPEGLKLGLVLPKKLCLVLQPGLARKSRRGLRVIYFLEDILESTIVFLEDGVLS